MLPLMKLLCQNYPFISKSTGFVFTALFFYLRR